MRDARLNTPFYGILDAGYVSPEFWNEKFVALTEGGAKTIQIRAKKETRDEKRTLLEQAIATNHSLPKNQQALIILNEDLDLCLEYENIGLHLEQGATPTEARQRLGSNRVLGFSALSPELIEKAIALGSEILDYFSVGPVFATQTKPNSIPVGLKRIEWVVSKRPELPFFCIGGINRRNIDQVAAAGAQQVVTISDVLLAPNTSDAVRETIDSLKYSALRK